MKKLTIIMLIAAMLVCSLAFVGCKDNGGDFKGAISEKTYDSREDAVKGFLQEEISGDAFNAEYVGYKKISELSQKEIHNLPISDDDKAGIKSVEKGEVEYREQPKSQEDVLTKYASDNGKSIVYIIFYTANEIKYFLPVIIKGDTLTASYFDYLFDMNRYLNCTAEFNFFNEHGTCHITENVIHFIKTMGSETVHLYYYYKDSDLFYCGVASDNTIFAERIGEFTISDILTSNYDHDKYVEYFFQLELFFGMLNYMDHSFFVKTRTGFEIKEKYKNFSDEYYTVSTEKDRISKIEAGIYVEDGPDVDKFQWNFTFSDFDSTNIEVPKEIVSAVDEILKNNG